VGRVIVALGVLGLACTATIVVSQADSISPLLGIPVVALAAATVTPRLAAITMCAWCCLAAASVGIFLVPCAAVMVAGARRHA